MDAGCDRCLLHRQPQILGGHASKAAQAMGDPYLLPAIAAVVLGGTSIGLEATGTNDRSRTP